jgi:pimeloyl-ACP methyl ester carboxylesterase
MKGLLLAGAALGVPALASEVIRRRAEPPSSPRWGRAHRYAGRHGEIVFQELGLSQAGRPPLVLLHSFGPGHDSGEWRATAERLAERYAVYAPDLPGWGRSAAPSRKAWRPSLYVEALEAFLAGVVGEPAVLVASGLAAAYAVRIAVDRPGLLRGLALVSPLGLDGGSSGGGKGEAFLGRLLRLPVLRDTILDLLTSRSAITHHLRKEVYAAPERVDAAMLDHHYRASHVGRSRAALAAYLAGDLDDDVATALPEIGLPVWIAWGRKSAAPRVEDADRWLHRLPHTAELEVFETSGALPHAEASAAFSRSLDRFVEGISS